MQPSPIQHRAPARRWRLNAEAEKAQRGFRQNRARHAESRLHHHSRHGGRHDVSEENARCAGAERASGLNELELARLQYLTSHQTRVSDPADHRERHHDISEARSQHRHERDGKENSREREQHVDRAADDVVQPPAEVTGDRAQQNADGRRDAHDGEADKERNARAGEHARKNIAPQFVEAERMREAGPIEAQCQLLERGIVGRRPGRHDRSDDRHQNDSRTDPDHEPSTRMRGSRKL